MSLRARDHDRNQAVETLQQAFVDGQLDAEELARRSAAALSAVHLSELERLIGDLQGAPRLAPDLRSTAARRAVPSSSRATNVVLGVVVGLSLLGIMVGLPVWLVTTQDNPDSTSASAVELGGEETQERAGFEHAATMTVQWSEVKDELGSRTYEWGTELPIEGVGTFRPTKEKLERVFEAWEQTFGSPYVRDLTLHADSMGAERPLGRTRPRLERWDLHGDDATLDLTSEASGAGRDLALFDVNDLDLDALMGNIARGVEELGVAEARLSWIDVGFDSVEEVPVVSIWVTNTFDESGWLTTTLDGRVIRENPYTP